MTTAALWLPPPSEIEAEAAITAFLTDWLGEWIAEPMPFRVQTVTAPQKDSVEIEQPDVANLGLACCAGRADLGNPSDTAVLIAVVSAMVADLASRLGSADHHRFSVAGPDWKLLLAADEEVLTRTRRSAAGSRRQPKLVSLSQAVAGETAKLGCHLGAATLSTGEISALSVGDVIVLSRSVMASVPLAVEGAIASSGEARIGTEDDALRVIVTEPLDFLRKS